MRDVWDMPDGDFVLSDVDPLGQPNRRDLGRKKSIECNRDLGKETSKCSYQLFLLETYMSHTLLTCLS
jgi:hypothetical protein